LISHLENIINKISEANPLAGKKLKRNFPLYSGEHKQKAEEFFNRYSEYLRSLNKTIDFAVDCYLKMIGDMFHERINFLESGKYSNTSYKEVEEKIYSKPEIMDYHMHGLILAQFLWLDQFVRFKFFSDNLLKHKPVKKYLEVGGGHGLYVGEAVKLLGSEIEFEVVDISQSSLNICMNLVHGRNVNFVLKDIFEYNDSDKFDFITAGEVVEHLEDPLSLLMKLNDLLDDSGTVYLTTPVNAPMIDHIYLFNSVAEIRTLIEKANLKIVDETQAYSDLMPEEQVIKHKIPLMYACFLKKQN